MCMNSFLLEENAGAWSHGAQMSLRSQLEELLPELLPSDPAQAIKGTELIRLVRLRLGEEYSDASLRYHFSFMASDPDSEIAKVERGQGYYRRQRDRGGKSAARGLLPLFLGEGESDALNCRARALALAVRQYDTTGRGVFVSAPVKRAPPGRNRTWPSWNGRKGSGRETPWCLTGALWNAAA